MAFAGGVVLGVVMLSGGTAWAQMDVCSLLSPAEAASALGVPEVSAGAEMKRCIWTPKKYQAGAATLTVILEGANDAAKTLWQGDAVTGVGDEAIEIVYEKSNSAVLHVRKGSTWFVVSVTALPVDQALQAEKRVGQMIASRM